MKAIVARRFGGPEVLALEDVPDPVAGPGEVLVRVGAVAVNFVDTIVLAGRYQFSPALPFTPGKGPAGTVVALGSGVTALSAGDRVLAMAEVGGYAELALAPAEQCYRLPPALPFTGAAAMSLAFDTAWFGLHERGRLVAGETVLVLGATGAVGAAALQLAKAAGARVLAGVSSMARAELARSFGADAVIDLGVDALHDGLRDQVRQATAGHGADLVLDMLGGDAFETALRALAWRGRLVVIGFAAGRIPTLKANYLLLKNIEVSGLQISDYRKRRPDLVRRCFREVFDLFEAGKVQPPLTRCLPLADAGDAMRTLLARSGPDRLVLVPGDAGEDR